jgi:hypothetical protein
VACAKVSLALTVRAASRRLETPVGVVGELEREPSRMGSLSEGRSLIVLGRASTGAHERLKPTGVNEIEIGQIDDHMRRVARLRIELPVEQARGGFIERAARPEDQYVGVAFRAAPRCGL